MHVRCRYDHSGCVEMTYCLGELSGHGDAHSFETLAGAACWRAQRYTGSQDASVDAHGAFITCHRLCLEPILRRVRSVQSI